MATASTTLSNETSTRSICEKLFKQSETPEHGEEEVDVHNLETEKETKQQQLLPAKQPTLLGDLHLLQTITQQLREITLSTASNNHDDADDEAAQSTARNVETDDLAALYCRRAAALLTFVDYDATTAMPVDILASGSSTEANQPAPMLEAVRQALHDAQAAAALASNNATIAEAHLLSAYCSRSLGELPHARAFTALAAAAFPDNPAVVTLSEQLDVEAHVCAPDVFPKLRMTSAVIATMMTNASAMHRQDEGSDNNDQPEQISTKQPAISAAEAEQSSFWSQVAPHFRILEEAAHSTWLENVERIMHQNVHHRCALPSEIRQLNTALQSTFATLALLLQSSSACSALGLEMTDDAAARTLDKLTQTASTSSHTLVQNRTARKWLVQTWAPAVLRALTSSPTSPFIDLSSDVMLMFSRLLQAAGSWRRCTAMAHSLAYTEMSYDLAKQVSGIDGNRASWSRLTMQCAEAYAIALLQRVTSYSEALEIFREILQAALHIGDQEYELRSRLHVARTLRLMNEPEIAHAELEQLLSRSRALNDVHVEAMAEYEMGEHFVQKEDLEAAQEHFQAAQALCNRTANCGNLWRPRSIQQAIAFYARLQPTTRRGAIRCSVSAFVRSINDEEKDDGSVELEAEGGGCEKLQNDRPKERRRAFCLKQEDQQVRTLMSTLMNTNENALSGPKPKRTMVWRESVYCVGEEN